MDINIGSRIKYKFPKPAEFSKTFTVGTVESIDEFYVVMLTDDSVKIKINFKNFENIEVLEQNSGMNLSEAI